MTPAPEAPEARPVDLPETPNPAHAYLSRLAALHDEAAETAHLANLLGRAPWTAGLLGLGGLGTALVCARSVSSFALAAWLMLVTFAVAAIGRSYGKAIEEPFDRAALKTFARDLSAILLYAGAAWGAGLFLALPADLSLGGAIAFTATIGALIVGILRARDMAFSFLVPATAVGAFSSLMRDASLTDALGILAGGLLVAAAATLLERLLTAASRTELG
ncbi:MAG TPA: hypothetical protein VMU22_14215 [Rhizomicrobium sp.]|nr:hypothetical protein [Rhizomicrobium sp.]